MARINKHHFQDDFLNNLVYEIESRVCGMDREAAATGLRLSDSQVKSALTRIKANLGNFAPLPARDDSPREVLFGKLAEVLHSLTATIRVKETEEDSGEGEPVPTREWGIVYDMILRSMAVRKSPEPGSRAYLDFLPRFLAQIAPPESE